MQDLAITFRKSDGQDLHELLPLLPPLPQPPHSQLLFDSEMIIGMLRERPKNCKLDVFGLTGKDTITYLEKIFTLHCLEQSVPESLGNSPPCDASFRSVAVAGCGRMQRCSDPGSLFT